MMDLDYILDNFTPGEETNTWTEEFAWIVKNDYANTAHLVDDIDRKGMRLPVLLGDDGRVWNGHHRLLVAWVLGWTEVPVVHADDGYTDEEAGSPPEYREDGS